jgi:hypothetical protein
MPKPENFEPSQKTQRLYIFDDMALEDKKTQAIISKAWGYGRKVGISCAYITQSWFCAPRFVQNNSSYVLLKKIKSKMDVNAIIKDSELDVDPATLFKWYSEATQDQQDFFLIDVKTNDPSLKYRQNL